MVIALVKASYALAFGGMAIVEVTFANELFPWGRDGSGTLGLIYLMIGLGSGLAPLLARRLTGDNPGLMQWALLVTYLVTASGYILMGWAFTLPILLLATFIRTSGSGTGWVYSSSLLQLTVPGKFLGRVFAFDLAMMTLASSISTLWVGWAKDSLSLTPQQISLLLGSVPTVMTIGWLIFMTLQVKRRQLLSSGEF